MAEDPRRVPSSCTGVAPPPGDRDQQAHRPWHVFLRLRQRIPARKFACRCRRSQPRRHSDYPSYVQDIMGPLFFDYGFGPFRWVVTSGQARRPRRYRPYRCRVLGKYAVPLPPTYADSSTTTSTGLKRPAPTTSWWVHRARILYADAEGRAKLHLLSTMQSHVAKCRPRWFWAATTTM